MNAFRKLVLGFTALALFASFATAVFAQEKTQLKKEPPKGLTTQDIDRMQQLIDDYKRQEPLMVSKIGGNNVYLAKGGIGGNDANVGFAVGKTGVIFIDSKNSPESEKDVLAEIAKITPLPVNTAILLHSDHEDGVTALPKGIPIIAQANTKTEMEVSKARDAVPADYFPTKTIDKDESMTIDGVKVRLLHWGPAHTSGDLAVFFPAQKVVFVGDVIVTDFPLTGTQIHPDLHGSVGGWIAAVKGMLALKADTYVSGHGDLFTKHDVQIKLILMETKYNKMKAMVAQGKSLDEIKTSLGEPTGPPTREAPGALPSPTVTTDVIYAELTNKE
jgi:cyclase